MGQISQEILDIGASASANISGLALEMETTSLTMQETLKNSSTILNSNIEMLKMKTKELEVTVKDLRISGQTLRSDLMAVSGSLDHLAATNDDHWRVNDLSWVKSEVTFGDVTSAVDNLEEKIGVLQSLAPFLQQMNASTLMSMETLRLNVTQLDQTAKSLKTGLSELESIIVVLDMNTSALSNSTVSLKKRAQKVESRVDRLQADTNEFLNGFAKLVEVQKEASLNDTNLRDNLTSIEAVVFELSQARKKSETNTTQLQLIYNSMEKHFVEMKQELFETQLHVVTLNASVHSSGGIRHDLITIGQAIANTTSYITKRIDRVETSTIVIRNEMGHLINETQAVEERLDSFMMNYTLAANDMSGTMTRLKVDMKRSHNRTAYLELGLAGLMNFSLEIDGTLKVVQDNVSSCFQGVNDMNVNSLDLAKKVIKLYELNAYLSKRIVENANNLKGNASKLTMNNDLLEAELKELTSNFNGVKITVSSQMKSVTDIETQVQKLNEGHLVTKNNLAAIKLDLSAINAESSGLSVFVSSMQSHISR